MDQRVRETITKYLGDLHALESHGLQAIGRQAAQLTKEGHPEALSAVRDFERTLEQHVAALNGRLKALGGSPTHPVKEAVAAAAGLVAGVYNAVRTEEASKSVRDDYTFISHTGVAYLMLATTAKALGDHDTEELAETGYRDTAAMIMRIDAILPRLVVQELRQDGLPAEDVADWAQKIVRSAWQPAGPSAASGA